MILLNFSKKNHKIIIKKVYDDIVNPKSQEYRAARNQIFDQIRQYKINILTMMKTNLFLIAFRLTC